MSQPSFSDRKGREYFPRLDFVKLRRIREIGVDLGNVEELGKAWAGLLVDDLKALDVIWLASRRDDITADDFQSAMDGDTLEAAREALRQAIVNFTPPARRATAEVATQKVMEGYLAAVADAERQVREIVATGLENAKQHGMRPPELPALLATSTINGV